MAAPTLTITLNPTIDASGEAEVVRPVHKVRTTPLTQEPGGGGINVARVVTQMGGSAHALYVAGGATGTLLADLLSRERFESTRVSCAANVRLAFNLYERSTGFEYRFVPEGEPVEAAAFDACLDHVEQSEAAYVVVSGSLPPGAPDDLLIRIADTVHRKGGRFVLDTSGPALAQTIDNAPVFLAKPSLSEMRALAGTELGEATARQAAEEIIARGKCEMLAITLGAEGAMLASAAGIQRLPALHVTTRSTVGAGDSFLGAMVWALAEGWSRDDAFRVGVAAGAAAAMTPGTELCHRDDVMRLYAEMAAR